MNEEIKQKLEDHDKRFDKIDIQIDFLVKKVLDNSDRLDRIENNMVTKKDHQEVMEVLDKLIRLNSKNDQELTFMGERVKK